MFPMFSAFFKPLLAAAVLVAVCLPAAPAGAAEGDTCNLPGSGNGRMVVRGEEEYCVPPAEFVGLKNCEAAGWGTLVNRFDVITITTTFISCQIPVRNFMESEETRDAGSCTIYLSMGNPEDPCAEVFGAGLDFPAAQGEGSDQRFVYNCPDMTESDPDYVSGGAQKCAAKNEKGVCAGLFGGGGRADESGAEEVCSGIDANDTFCIVGESDAFPCRGLFRHVLQCNLDYNRPALNPFFCGRRCDGANEVAKGASCACKTGYQKNEAGDPPCRQLQSQP